MCSMPVDGHWTPHQVALQLMYSLRPASMSGEWNSTESEHAQNRDLLCVEAVTTGFGPDRLGETPIKADLSRSLFDSFLDDILSIRKHRPGMTRATSMYSSLGISKESQGRVHQDGDKDTELGATCAGFGLSEEQDFSLTRTRNLWPRLRRRILLAFDINLQDAAFSPSYSWPRFGKRPLASHNGPQLLTDLMIYPIPLAQALNNIAIFDASPLHSDHRAVLDPAPAPGSSTYKLHSCPVTARPLRPRRAGQSPSALLRY
ncbi:hypothetical protein B0H13DRAFT_2451398 [Mycena leptocephala]|nr:hypothetical protein B0H13DRAFT_2451398 [Mycena leptocephala]